MKENSKQPIILFDGVCNLCNNSVQYIIRRDKKKIFYFSSLQSDYSKELLSKYQKSNTDLDSLVLISDDKIYFKSSAVIKISKILGKYYNLMMLFLIIPESIRNLIYDFVAKNRYKWFGKQDNCMVPNQEIKDQFL